MLFTIIITTFNYEKYIQQAVESAINQDYSGHYETIVIDDCSTDNTSTILNRYNTLIRITNKTNLSLEVSANKAIHKASGKYIIRLDADDYLEPYFLNEIASNISTENYFYYGNYTSVAKNGSTLSKTKLTEYNRDEIRCRGDFLATGTVYSKKMLLSVGVYNENIKNCGLENYELTLSLIESGFIGKLITKNLFFYRRHEDNLSKNKLINIMQYGNSLAQKYQLGSYKINQYHPYLKKADIITKLSEYIQF